MIIENARVKECEKHGLRGVMLAGRWEGDQGDACCAVTSDDPEGALADVQCRMKLDEHDGTVEIRRRNVE